MREIINRSARRSRGRVPHTLAPNPYAEGYASSKPSHTQATPTRFARWCAAKEPLRFTMLALSCLMGARRESNEGRQRNASASWQNAHRPCGSLAKSSNPQGTSRISSILETRQSAAYSSLRRKKSIHPNSEARFPRRDSANVCVRSQNLAVRLHSCQALKSKHDSVIGYKQPQQQKKRETSRLREGGGVA